MAVTISFVGGRAAIISGGTESVSLVVSPIARHSAAAP
jgi:hypothetical protein